MKKTKCTSCRGAGFDFKTEIPVFLHTRIDYTSLVGLRVWDVGPAANHGHMKVSDALS